MTSRNGETQRTDSAQEKRILVLGSAPHTRLVHAYTWDKLPSDLNVADYDVVILNLVPCLDEQFARQMNPDRLPSWQQFARLLFSKDSEVIFIGIPPGRRILSDSPFMNLPSWLPITPAFIFESGETVQDTEPEFDYYFRHVRRWSFYATCGYDTWHPSHFSGYCYIAHPQANNMTPKVRSLAQTRFQKPIAFELGFQAIGSKGSALAKSGRVIWLPPPTEISDYEAVDLILREQYGLRFEQAPPDWVEDYTLPLQMPIEAEIVQYEDEIRQLEDKLTAAQGRLQEVTRFRKLLYEQGEGLERAVRDALRELGAQVQDPQSRAGEDGRLIDPSNRVGVLEIKGRVGSLHLNDVRQIDRWVRDAIAAENRPIKGILIANMYCGEPPSQRETLFPDDRVRTAERYEVCLMTTTQLFRALCKHQLGELDVTAFWDTIFSTSGVCQLPELDGE